MQKEKVHRGVFMVINCLCSTYSKILNQVQKSRDTNGFLVSICETVSSCNLVKSVYQRQKRKTTKYGFI